MAARSSQFSSPLLTTMHGNAWAPSMPNSDVWNLQSSNRFIVSLPPIGRLATRRVMAVRTPSLRIPVQHTSDVDRLPEPVLYQVGRAAFSSPPVSTSPSSLSASPLSAASASVSTPVSSSRTRHSIGLGHPSTSPKHENTTTRSETPLSTPRINSSTIKPRTKRIPRRVLSSIPEHPRSNSVFSPPASPSASALRAANIAFTHIAFAANGIGFSTLF